MASDVKKIELGPAIVEYGDAQDKVIFETTIGGVVLTVETTYREQKIDQKGETVVSKRITGRNAKVTVPFGEYDLDKIPQIMVGATLVKAATGDGKKVVISTAVGHDLITMAKKVVIKPVAAMSDPSKWATLPLAFPETELQYNYDNDNERITNVTLSSTPDDKDIVLILGDETVKATP
ncbi:hypothetical protein MH117_09675 [Paenibacillus sp. ACRRX]|uniref:hypothetical protein n=1 Tax=Paenibacillus sp. ACRRX TaxID=2918206 RepID=UPI001EF44E55|nr:hypothetical protein [Paenibacillus sp. ACRRX]MCG7407692.1 hypothetical protein [Paenibacillus sp. ACRRX]